MTEQILATLVARALVLGCLGWCVYAGLGILAQSLIGLASTELDEGEGSAAVSRICDACDGTGDSTGADWCEECSGTGRELDDPGEAWDDAHDRWTDGQLGVA